MRRPAPYPFWFFSPSHLNKDYTPHCTQVLDLSSSDDEDEDAPLSNRQPLAPRPAPAAAAQRPPLAFRRFEGPIEIDLTAQDDVCCLVRLRGVGSAAVHAGGRLLLCLQTCWAGKFHYMEACPKLSLGIPCRCQVCGGAADAENLQLCDTCDRGCHVACGALRRVPGRAGWHCPGCCAAAGKAKQAGGRLHKAGAAAAAAAARQLDDDDSEDDAFVPAKASLGCL